MAASNYDALGKGLRIYTEAMRGLIKERLIAGYPHSWWKDGVLEALGQQQRDNLRRSLERDPNKDRLEHLDPGHFVPIVTRNFDRAFRDVFSDFRKTQSLLQLAALARNDWAHPRNGDMPADEVGQSLYVMEQILGAANLPQEADVGELRRAVLRIEATPVEIRDARAAGPGELPYWWQVCEPHDAFKSPATIDESLFAATLGGVHAKSAREEYLDPRIFFTHTYFTENLKQTIRDVASRLSGGDGPSVTEMQTPFGGGKTHALLTLYHLVNSPAESLSVPGVREALGDVRIPANARVLVFDGQEFGTDPVQKEDGASVFTLWGELAYQASSRLYQQLIVDTDSRGEAPGNALYRQILTAASPCLILIDELVSYLVKLKFANTRRTQNLYRQTVQFVQELLQEAGNVRGVCVLISLPKSRREFGGIDPALLSMELGVLGDLQARADRVVSKRTPVNDDEIYTLMRKRLFKTVDSSAAERVVRTYREVYERTRALYDSTIFSADYLKQQIDAYPLHPELIDVLYKKWSTASDFPRTRAVLQLLANIVADQWVSRRDSYAIQSAHVNLERERIRTRIVSAAGVGTGYDAVVAADIIGGDAHADNDDRRRGGEYERYQIARGIATTLLMHSFGGSTRTGALTSELRLGTAAPNVGPEYVSEVLQTLEQSLWYVHREGELLRFQTKVNIYRVIAQSAEVQPAPIVAERLRDALAGAIGSVEGFRVLEWAGAEGIIADRPEPVIAVLTPRFAVLQEDDKKLIGRQPIDQLWEKHGGGLREWRNALVLVAPDKGLWEKAEEAMREVLAYESVITSAEKGSVEVSQLELRELRSRFQDKKESLRTSITTAYRWVFHPAELGLNAIALPVPATKDERIVRRAVDRLSDLNYGEPKVLRKVSAIYFGSKLAPRLWKDAESPLDIGEISRRFLQWTYLPILPTREETLRSCIREGLAQQLWAVAIGDARSMSFQKLVEKPDEIDGFATLFDGSASLVKGEFWSLLRDELRTEEPAPAQPETNDGTTTVAPPRTIREGGGPSEVTPPINIPAPTRRYSRVRLRFTGLRVAKTGNLQPYLFKVLQEQDAAAELALTVEVTSGAGLGADVLNQRIVEAFEQLGIGVTWEPA